MQSRPFESRRLSHGLSRDQPARLRRVTLKLVLTVQVDGNIYGADVSDGLQVRDPGTFQLRGIRRVPHIDPAHSLISVDEVHGHGRLGGDGRQSGHGAA